MSRDEDTPRENELLTFRITTTTYNTRDKHKFRFHVDTGDRCKDHGLYRQNEFVTEKLRGTKLVLDLLTEIQATCEEIADIYDGVLVLLQPKSEPDYDVPFHVCMPIGGKERFGLWTFVFEVTVIASPYERRRYYNCEPTSEHKQGYRLQEMVVDSFDLYYNISNEDIRARADKHNESVRAVFGMLDRIVDIHEKEVHVDLGEAQSSTKESF